MPPQPSPVLAISICEALLRVWVAMQLQLHGQSDQNCCQRPNISLVQELGATDEVYGQGLKPGNCWIGHELRFQQRYLEVMRVCLGW